MPRIEKFQDLEAWKNGDKEFVRFLSVAKASCFEVYSQLYVALDQNYIDEKEFV